MTATVPKTIELPSDPATSAGQVEIVPRLFPTEMIVSLPENPVYTTAMLADLVPSVEKHGFLVPGMVAPSPDLPSEEHRQCLEGHRRLAVARLLNRPFWAFDLGRFVPEEERIELMFQHHQCRRVMDLAEIAERAARYIDLTHCSDGEAARALRVSPATLCRAFGDKRIPDKIKEQCERLGVGRSVRSLVAALPLELMPQVIEFALTARPDGKRPSRDQVASYSQQLRKQNNGQPKSRKPKTITLRMNGRAVTFVVGEKDSATSVAEDLKAIVTRLGKNAEVSPDGWPFLFQ